jgi:retron-type reverse transcriptase
MKVVNTYEEYLNVCKEINDTSVYAWMPKVSYVVVTVSDLENLFDKVDHKTLKNIITEIIENYGKEFYYGTLIGLEITNEDYYYVYERFGKRTYDSCVGGLRK